MGWFALNPRRHPIYDEMGCFESRGGGTVAGAPRWNYNRGGGRGGAARRGELERVRIVDETILYLALGIANIVSLNPEMIVLGGGLMRASDLFLDPIRRSLPQWTQPLTAQQVRIELKRLGEDAGVLGAARLASLE